MNTILGIIIFLSTFWSAVSLARKFAAGNRIFVICLGAVLFFSLVVVNSRILSLFDALNSYLGWISLTALSGGLCFIVGKWTRPTMVGLRPVSILEDFWTWFMDGGRLSKIAVFFSAYFVFVMGVQLLDILILAPSQWDSFTYIMPRVLFYLQHGNFNPYPTNDLPQIAHVTGWSQIQAFGLIATGRSEIGFSIFSLVLFCVGLLATMELGRILSGKPLGGWIAGFVYATSVNVINLSSTPQSDMPIAGFLACGILGLIVWIDKLRSGDKNASSLVFSGIVAGSFALAAVMKASALLALAGCVPLILLLVWRLQSSKSQNRSSKTIFQLVAGVCVAMIIFLCGGYYSNYKNFGHPLGSEEWRAEHEFSNVPINERIVEGTKNLARYLTHFLSFDGFYSGPPGVKNSPIRRLQRATSHGANAVLDLLGLDLEESKYSRVPFKYFTEWPPKPISNSDLTYPGIFFIISLVLVFPAWWKNRIRIPCNLLALALLSAAVLYLLLQSFLALYDPWRGRSFSNLVVMLAPICGLLAFSMGKLPKSVLGAILLLGIIQGTSAIVFRDSGPLIALKEGQSTIFNPGDRASQYARFLDLMAPPNAHELKSSLRNYFWLLPESPKLATTIEGGQLIYPFLFNAKNIEYFKSEKDISIEKFDAALFGKSGALGDGNTIKIGSELNLWRNQNSFSQRDIEDFDPFFGLEKYSGIGQVEGPYGKNGHSFRLMTSSQAELQFKPIAEQSTLFLEVSSVEVPNQIKVFVDEKLLGEIKLIKKGETYKFSCDLDTTKKEVIKIDLNASNGFDDKNQARAIFGFFYKALLMPKLNSKF